ncbi:MAG: transposase [bacterium]|nr:transposase [bacterium]
MSILALIEGKKPEELGSIVKNSLDEFVKDKIEETLNDLLQGEIEDFLTDALREQTFDIRNGYYKRHLKTKYGRIEISVPRDRLNLFETKIIQPYKQTAADLEYVIQSLYLRGLSQNEIVKYLDEAMGIDLSRESIGKMVRKILSSALEFKKKNSKMCCYIS